MKLVHGSVVDTAVAFIEQNFGVKMDTEAVAQQMKTMSFKQQMDLVDSMKEDNPDEFQALIKIEQSKEKEQQDVEEAGTISPTASVMQTTKSSDTKAANAARRTNLDIKALDDGPAAQRKVPGQPGNDAAMGVEPVATGKSAPTDAATDAAGEAASLAQQNADRIKELTKKLIAGRQQ